MLIYIGITAALACAVYVLRRRTAGKLALLLLTLSLCFTALETYYRYFYVRSDGFGRLSRNFAERYYQLDAHGLRASNLPPSLEKKNIVVLGDSHVFGAGLKTPAERLSEQLASHYRQLHIINLGLSGWDTPTQIDKLTAHLGDTRAQLPLVVLVYFFNDIEEEVTDEERQRLGPPEPPREPTTLDRALQAASDHSRFVEFFYYRLAYPRLVRDRLEQIGRFYSDPAILQRHVTTLERLRATARERYSSELLVALLPYLHSEEWLHQPELYNRLAQELAARGFDYVDMQPHFAKHGTRKLVVSRFDAHTNAFANQLTAEALIPLIDAELQGGSTREP